MRIRASFFRRIVGLAVFVALAALPQVLSPSHNLRSPGHSVDPEIERIARFLEQRAERTIDPALRRQVATVVVEESRLADFDPLFILAVMEVESSFIPGAVSAAQAKGLLQLRDITIREIVKHEELPAHAVNEPEDVINLRLGIRYLAMMRDRYPTMDRALAAWNAGPVAVNRELAKTGAVPDRWLAFARKVQREYRRLQRQFEAQEQLASAAHSPSRPHLQ